MTAATAKRRSFCCLDTCQQGSHLCFFWHRGRRNFTSRDRIILCSLMRWYYLFKNKIGVLFLWTDTSDMQNQMCFMCACPDMTPLYPYPLCLHAFRPIAYWLCVMLTASPSQANISATQKCMVLELNCFLYFSIFMNFNAWILSEGSFSGINSYVISVFIPFPSTFLYLKFLVVWVLVLLADFVLEFRFEYLWPFWLFIRSVYDSFRYQGLVRNKITWENEQPKINA